MPEVATESLKMESYPSFLIATAGDTIPTGVPIPAKGKKVDPGSTAKPKSIWFRGQTKVVPVKTTRRPEKASRMVRVPEDLKTITPGENGIPLPQKIPAQGDVLPVLHSPSVPASPLAFKDHATNGLQYLSLAQGLTLTNVCTLMEDSKGYLWFGGGGGACRYDGTSFTYFTEKEGFPLLSVWSIFEDSKGRFWFGSKNNGVCRYDGKTFTHFTTKHSFNGNWVRSIQEDKQGSLWFATDKGATRYDPDDHNGRGSFTHFTTQEGLIGNQVWCIMEDNRGHIWFGTGKPEPKGMCRYDGKRFTHYTTKEGLIGNAVRSILQDKNNDLWFSTGGNGACRFDGTYFKHYSAEENLADNMVLAMIEDTEGNLWFGGRGGTATLYKPHPNEGLGSFIHFTREEGMSSDFVMDILEDSSGNIWFGMLPGAVNCYHSSGFSIYNTNNGLGYNAVRGMVKDSKGTIWIGHLGGLTVYEPENDGLGSAQFIQFSGLREYGVTVPVQPRLLDSRGHIWMYNHDGAGLGRFIPDPDKKGGRFTHLTTKEGLSSNYINAVAEDQRGYLWIATNNGVSCYVQNSESQKETDAIPFTHFTTKEGLSGDQVRGILEDKQGHLWFATDNGLSCFVPGDETLDRFDGNFTHFAIPHSLSGTILEDNQGGLWFDAVKNGVYRFIPNPNTKDTIAGTFTHFSTENGLIDNDITSMMEDSDGNFWFGTKNGLSRFTPDSVAAGGAAGTFTHYTVKDGLGDNHIGPILEDKQKNIWISTNGGITLLSPPVGEDTSLKTEHYQIITYNRARGLKQFQRASQVVLDSNSNQIWWSSNEGLTTFAIDQFQTRTVYQPTVHLNTVAIKQHFIDYRRLQNDTYQNQLPFGKELVGNFTSVPAFCNYPLDLSLPFSLNHLTFHFSAIDWQAPYDLKYSYIMEGLDDEWSSPSPEKKADYRSLPPGQYTFQVRAISTAQIESEVFAYKFRILPPWWLSWWAYIIYVGSICLLLYGIRNYEARRYRTQSENRRLRELDTFKTRLYTNITHEFRTPLTIILGMARQIKEDPKRWYSEGLKMITRNCDQLLGLVNQMLDLSKLDKGQLELKMQQAEVVSFLHYLVQSFESYAAGRDIQLHFLKEIDRLEMDFDPDQLTKIVSNLLSNAVKYTPDKGQVYIMVDIQSPSSRSEEIFLRSTNSLQSPISFLRIKVKDTGPGIHSEALPRIFDRFYQVDNSTTRKTGGTGLGLALTKELVQLMEGSIQVQSKLGEGTIFSVLIPVRQLAPKAAPSHKALRKKNAWDDTSPLELVTASGPTGDNPLHAKAGISDTIRDLPLVLLVEDNPDVLTYLAACLEADYQLKFAVNGKEGIDQALEIVPDIIISDVMMPEKDGYELCATLKEDVRTSHVPIILLTAKADQGAKIQGFKAGVDAYLTKPFDREELFLRMQKLTELRRQLQARFSELKPIPENGERQIVIENRFLKRLREVVETHFSDEGFGIAQLCREIGMSRSQLHIKLKALSGKSASIYIRSIRLEKAKALLETSDLNISEVAYEVGFRTPVYFTQVFTEMEGVSPSQFRDLKNG